MISYTPIKDTVSSYINSKSICLLQTRSSSTSRLQQSILSSRVDLPSTPHNTSHNNLPLSTCAVASNTSLTTPPSHNHTHNTRRQLQVFPPPQWPHIIALLSSNECQTMMPTQLTRSDRTLRFQASHSILQNVYLFTLKVLLSYVFVF